MRTLSLRWFLYAMTLIVSSVAVLCINCTCNCLQVLTLTSRCSIKRQHDFLRHCCMFSVLNILSRGRCQSLVVLLTLSLSCLMEVSTSMVCIHCTYCESQQLFLNLIVRCRCFNLLELNIEPLGCVKQESMVKLCEAVLNLRWTEMQILYFLPVCKMSTCLIQQSPVQIWDLLMFYSQKVAEIMSWL